MSLESTCQGMLNEFDSMMTDMDQYKDGLLSDIKKAGNKINQTIGTPLAEIQGAVNDVLNVADVKIPDLSVSDDLAIDLGEAQKFIECFTETPGAISGTIGLNFDDPVSAINGMKDSLMKDIGSAVDDAFSAIPEIDAAKALDGIVNKFGSTVGGLAQDITGGLGITDMIKSMDGTINCIASSACGTDVQDELQSRMDQMDTFIDDIPGMNDDGSMDIEQIMTDAGLSGDQLEGMKGITDSLSTITNNINTAVDDGTSLAQDIRSGEVDVTPIIEAGGYDIDAIVWNQ